MTSLLARPASEIYLINPNNVVTPTYFDGSLDIAVPFTYNKRNGEFDMKFANGFTDSTSVNGNNSLYIRGSSFGAIHLVSRIGPNIKTWFETNLTADPGSVKMHKAPVIVKTNILSPEFDPNNIDCFTSGLTTPPDFDAASGSVSNQYYSTYLFRSPLVVSYEITGTKYYTIFNTQYEGNT